MHRKNARPLAAAAWRLGALATGLGALAACGGGAAPPPPEVSVVAAEVVQREVPVRGEWIGTTEGFIDAQIRARTRGYLVARKYTEGGRVKEGDVLFEIDPRPYETALAQKKGDLARAQALQAKSRQDVQRYRPLAAQKAVSQEELDNAIQAERAAAAAVESAAAAVQQAQLDLDWTRVRAPVSGIAGIAQGQVGELVEPNTLLTTVSQLDPMKVQFPISEREYLRFAERITSALRDATAKADATAPPPDRRPLDLVLADGSVYGERGWFALPNREVDRQTGSIIIQGYFPNPDGLLRPGLYARVRAVTGTLPSALLVPQRAVRELQGSQQVAVVAPDGTVDLRAVTVGERIDGLWVIQKGLEPGERVVVEGLQKVRQGMKVSLETPGAPDAPPPATTAGSHG
jgi:membrane fusion protein (multidrug efflux system)